MATESKVQGMACPQCHQDDLINITGTAKLHIRQDTYDVEWGNECTAGCSDCGFEGHLGDFAVVHQARVL